MEQPDEPWIHETPREVHDHLPDGTIKLLLVLALLSKEVDDGN
jgi:hypothetical protein